MKKKILKIKEMYYIGRCGVKRGLTCKKCAKDRRFLKKQASKKVRKIKWTEN